MRQPNFPHSMLADILRASGKARPEQVMEIINSFTEYRRVCNNFEAQLYSVTHERDRLKAENEFLIRLFNIKQEEFDVSLCSGIQAGALAGTGERSSGIAQGQEMEGA